MTAGGGVDVLAEVVRDMDRLSEVGASYTFAPDYVQKVREASAAIAELIAADREYDEADAACLLVSSSDERREAWERVRAARARRASALAAVGGSK